MSKKYSNPILDSRGVLFGIATLMIVFHHLTNRGIPGLTALPETVADIVDFVFVKAYIGVDIFLFLSAVGLCYSMERNTVKAFYCNRFRRVAVPWLVIMIPVFIVEDVILCGEGILEVLLDTTTLRYWVDNDNAHTPWFVPFILALYILFPMIYKLDVKTKHIGTVILAIVAVIGNILFSLYPNYIYSEFTFCFARLPIFLIGVAAADILKQNDESSKVHVAGRFAFLAVIGAVYIGWFFMDLPTGIDMQFGGVAALGLIVLYAYVIKPIVPKRLSKILVFIGTVSLEVYLVHTVIIRVLDSNDVPTIWFVAQFVLLPLSSVLIAKLASWVSERILKAADRLNRKSKA